MKKFITILISCSLALAASAMAQQPEESAKPKKEKAEKSQPANEAKPAPKAERAPKEHAETKVPGQKKGTTESTETTPKPQAETKVKGKGKEPANAEATATSEQGVKGKKERGAHTESATATNAASPSATVNEPMEKGKKGRNARTEAATANKTASPAPTVATTNTQVTGAQANQPNAQGGNKLNAQAKKPDPQTVQKIKTEHANFHAQPKPDKVPAVTFNETYRISGSEQWQGPQYEVFRSYHPERHERGWYHSHFGRIELIGGGYYYWNNGYWYPAWGYDPSAEYYAYDAPIYVGHSAEPPDRVIADVQAALQQMGYYQGEVDGLLGPLTRQALVAYQTDNGLYATAVIDEPTLQSLDLG